MITSVKKYPNLNRLNFVTKNQLSKCLLIFNDLRIGTVFFLPYGRYNYSLDLDQFESEKLAPDKVKLARIRPKNSWAEKSKGKVGRATS